MSDRTLYDALRACATLLPESFRQEQARLLTEEHLGRLAARLAELAALGVPATLPPPHFAGECTPPLTEAWAHFEQPLRLWQAGGEGLPQSCAAALLAADTRSVLLLLGQRLTSASITDARALPPTRVELLAAATRQHSGALTVAARALTKHVVRAQGDFWGAVTGSTAAKNELALKLLQRILDGATWWNVFGHFVHEMVYEVRVPSGHGARWSSPHTEFIGFLEPFDEREEEGERGASAP